MIWRAAIKLAYDGRSFMGSQRQPGERTVESEIIAGLVRIGAIESVTASRFRMASRTDRGVSALGNVAAFDTSFSRPAMLRAINSAVEDVYVYGVAEVPPTFSPRRARGRWYRYMMSSRGLDVERMIECGAALQGQHDFRRFCKPEGRSTVKVLESVALREVDGILIIDIRAREFLRNMVRRMVAALFKVGEAKATVAEVRSALGGRNITFGLAPAEGLTLMDIDYGFPFSVECPPTMSRRAEEYRLDAFARLDFADSLLQRCRE
ncbi:MAG: tRNA pseudouridine(38-40) synthase TruA [Methanomassiliicoccus sp.]|nr:tRNA pseudouridine(38-40) synthase TruA [Methanomassiliicoccus sp.]